MGILYYEFNLEGTAVNKERYKKVFDYQAIYPKHSEMWVVKDQVLLQVSVLALWSLLVQFQLTR